MGGLMALAEGTVNTELASLDFSDALTTSFNAISASYGKYILIAIPIGLGIWGAPMALKLVKKFFSSLTR
ncbi:MAG: hypothetical protein NC489_46790 [Ruminococcus flavefaciens]|nr:hypothetical protein [Ruminococcus flavefaciens]